MLVIVGFLVFIAAIGGLIYVLLIYGSVPGAKEQRLGVLEPLPDDVGKWKIDEDSDEGKDALQKGLKREARMFHDVQTDKLVRQVRYRNRATNEIVRIDPDEPVRRKRIRS
jgi:hypothetical protein